MLIKKEYIRPIFKVNLVRKFPKFTDMRLGIFLQCALFHSELVDFSIYKKPQVGAVFHHPNTFISNKVFG